ncbi:MAG: GNAT family N-acetyltransferase [Staphylococcus sp.]|nr:GNAT family N-acetyltransferase [Staphylococcus sp.]
MEYRLRRAIREDLGRIMEIMGHAKAQMAREGSRQWDESYPAPENILTDIAAGNGYVLTGPDDIPVAYGAIIFKGEPAYAAIDGCWLTEGEPYVVLHRLAVAEEAKGRGVASQFFDETARLAAERGAESFRVDTNYDNHRMLHLMVKLGFTYCGEVTYGRGSRKAFEKVIV